MPKKRKSARTVLMRWVREGVTPMEQRRAKRKAEPESRQIKRHAARLAHRLQQAEDAGMRNEIAAGEASSRYFPLDEYLYSDGSVVPPEVRRHSRRRFRRMVRRALRRALRTV